MTIPKPNLETLNAEYQTFHHDIATLRVHPTLDVDEDGSILSAGIYLNSPLEHSLRQPNRDNLPELSMTSWREIRSIQEKLNELVLPVAVPDYLNQIYMSGNGTMVHETYNLIFPRSGAKKLYEQLGDAPLRFVESKYTIEFIPSLEGDGSYLIVLTNTAQVTVKISEPGQKLIVAERIIKLDADDNILGQKFNRKVVDTDEVTESLNNLSRRQAYWLKVQNLLDARPGGSAGLES